MYYPEELVAMGLTLGLGLLFLLRPSAVYAHGRGVFRADTGRGGRWGADPEPADRVRLAIRALGVGLLVLTVALAASPLWRDAVV